MKVYQINDIVPERAKIMEYHVGIFEDTPDPDIKWPHRHACYSLVWFTQGTGINVIDFNEFDIRPNRVFTMSPRQIHNWNYSTDSCRYFLLIGEPSDKRLNINTFTP